MILKLNWLEKVLVNSPFDAVLQRRYEAPRFLSMGGPMKGGAALEIGCGQGLGAQIILDMFAAQRVDAFDLDADMIRRAQRRFARANPNIRLWIGDATTIAAPDNSYDAVFDFVIIHHIPNWRDVLAEVHRVLKPGGRFYAQEGLKRLVVHPVLRRLVDHPQEDPFDHDAFCSGMQSSGLQIVDTWHFHNWFGFYIADKPDTLKRS